MRRSIPLSLGVALPGSAFLHGQAAWARLPVVWPWHRISQLLP